MQFETEFSNVSLYDMIAVSLENDGRNTKLQVVHEGMHTILQPLRDCVRLGFVECVWEVMEAPSIFYFVLL